MFKQLIVAVGLLSLGSVFAFAEDFDGSLIKKELERERADLDAEARSIGAFAAAGLLSQATASFDDVADEWAALGPEHTEEDVIAAFGTPAIKHQSLESKVQVYDYHYAGGIACQVLLLEDGSVADKQILLPEGAETD